jgi:hypothetical protein
LWGGSISIALGGGNLGIGTSPRGYGVTAVVVTWNPTEINDETAAAASTCSSTASSTRPLSSSSCAVTFLIKHWKLPAVAAAACPYPIPASDAVATPRRNFPGPKTGEVRSAVYVSNAEPLVTTSLHSNSPVVVVNCIPVTGTERLCSEVIVPITGSVSPFPGADAQLWCWEVAPCYSRGSSSDRHLDRF